MIGQRAVITQSSKRAAMGGMRAIISNSVYWVPMLVAAFAVLLAWPAFSQEAGAPCWSVGATSFTAIVDEPGKNFSVLAGPRTFAEVCRAGAVVANGTFFSGDEALGDVIVDGQAVAAPHPRRFRSGSRSVDLGKRWGIGLLKGATTLAVADGDSALGAMQTYLGGAGILLMEGVDVSSANRPIAGEWGASFSRSDILDAERARTVVGLRRGPDGRQQLILLSLAEPPGASVAQAAAKLKALGATEAVFYDGGGAAAFAAGGACLKSPSNPGEDSNPTHIVLKACR